MTQEISTEISSIDISDNGEVILLKDDHSPFGYVIMHKSDDGNYDKGIFLTRFGFKQLMQAMIEVL